MDNITFIEMILGLVITVVGVAGAYIITMIASFYRAKREDILTNITNTVNKSENGLIDNAIKRVMTIVDNVVNALNDTYKKDLIEATEDGKLTDEEKKMLRDKALEIINAEVGDGTKEILQDIIGDFDEWIKTLIELAVTASKKKTTKTK